MSTNNNPDHRSVRRLALLQHGGILGQYGKTGLSLLRYSHAEIDVVIDQETAGRSLHELTRIPLKRDIPIVASMAEALSFKPDAVAIGIAVPGGALPEHWMQDVRVAVRAGVSVWNGLHTPLSRDPGIAAALHLGAKVWDMRQEPTGLSTGTGAARSLSCRRVLFVGTDMAIGKMTAALELDRAARRRGISSKFIATGQGGMMIAGDGVCLDGVRLDFASGAIEAEVMRYGPQHDVLWVEGQGSLLNPASTATLPLMRGSQPTHLILVHRAGMTHLSAFPHIKIPPLDRVVELYEEVASSAGAFASAPVIGVALNSWGLTEVEAAKEVDRIGQVTGRHPPRRRFFARCCVKCRPRAYRRNGF